MNYKSSFKIEITTNQVAEQLLNALDPATDKVRREELVTAIIAPLDAIDFTHALKHIYFGLNNIKLDAPKFKESDKLYCKDRVYNSYERDDNGDWVGIKDAVIGDCALTAFNSYKQSNKYEVEYMRYDSQGTELIERRWVSENDLTVDILTVNTKKK